MSAPVARARGLQARLLGEPLLVDIERAPDAHSLALALGRAGLAEDASPAAIERLARAMLARDLATLARWSARDALLVLELDEDVRSLRAIIRGIAAHVPAERRRLATVPTARLPEPVLATLAAASSIAAVGARLAALSHPLAPALAAADEPAIDVVELELALATTFAAIARLHAASDRALRSYVTQTIDFENAASALLLSARGGDVPLARCFIPGGERLSRERFVALAPDTIQDVLAATFARTPLARRIDEDAALDWQLATQRALRRSDPHGLAAVIYMVLCRRRELRTLRRAAWRLALGGAA